MTDSSEWWHGSLVASAFVALVASIPDSETFQALQSVHKSVGNSWTVRTARTVYRPLLASTYTARTGRALRGLGARLQYVFVGDYFSREAKAILGIALLVRLAALPLSLLQVNTYAQADSINFGRHAARIASGLLTGNLSIIGPLIGSYGIDIYQTWGLILSPLWFLPGPSTIYAYFFVIGISIATIHNIYTIGEWLRDPLTGVLAALPVTIFPTFVFVQTTLLRESAVLFTVTAAARVLVVPPRFLQSRPRRRAGLVAVFLAGAAVLRLDNAPIYAAALAAGVTTAWFGRDGFEHAKRLVVAGVLGLGSVAVFPQLSGIIDYLAEIRARRARGRTAYFVDVSIDTLPEAVAFTPVGALYFLFSPFPWMVGSALDAVTSVFAMVNLAIALVAIPGARYAFRRSPPVTVGLIVGFLAAVGVYGLGTANAGTAIRHRQMFLWVVYLFAAIAVSRWLTDRQVSIPVRLP